jgi:hypothetical protein
VKSLIDNMMHGEYNVKDRILMYIIFKFCLLGVLYGVVYLFRRFALTMKMEVVTFFSKSWNKQYTVLCKTQNVTIIGTATTVKI